jgi:GH25 family lysozyme M1 (1,4-beta-N-acetylmuramidase)
VGSRVKTVVTALVLVVAASAASGASAATPNAKGLDVSHWQGKIQWPRVAAAGYTFAFGKATESTTYTDPTYATNRSGAESAGLTFGAYHFGRPGGSGDAGIVSNAIAQADYFLNVAQPQAGELPPVLDLESKGSLAVAGLQKWTSAWLDQVAARTGVAAFVYASPSFWKTALGDTVDVANAGYPLWIAHWTTNGSPIVPAEGWGGRSWTFWQHSSHGSVPGISPQVDLDRFRGVDASVAAIHGYPIGVPQPSAVPTIVGTAQSGKTLAAVPGAWAGGKPLVFSYQWQRCDAAGAGCAPILGATAETYLPVTDDVGHALAVTVTAQSSAGTASASSPVTPAVSSSGSTVTRPVATSAPTVSGTPQAGQTLSLTVGLWTGSPTTFTYQWRRCSAVATQCVAIVGAAASTYTLTPDDIGATISPVVTATGRGGSTSAPAQTTAPVVAAPVPDAVPGSTVAVAGAAGAVSTLDGSATVTWQPGAVPAGSTVSLTVSGRGLNLIVSPTLPQLPWPVDVSYAAPTADVVATSTDNKVWSVAPRLATPALPVAQLTGTYTDVAGLTHVLLRMTGRIAMFTAGAWGDPNLVAAGPPKPRLVGALHVKRLRSGVVVVTGRVVVPSQARLFVNIVGKTSVKRSQLRRPGAIPVRVAVSGLRLTRGTAATLRIAARDPYGRRAALVTRFRTP